MVQRKAKVEDERLHRLFRRVTKHTRTSGVILILLRFVGKFGAIIVLPSERQILAAISGALFLLAAITLFFIPSSKPTPLFPPTVTSPPPAAKGDIYAVITNNTGDSLDLSLEWGTWNTRRTIDVSNYDGLVLHLRHTDDDSYLLHITTNGNVGKGPYQGGFPIEWDNEKYKRVSL